jgi:hypothetical protein
MAESMNILGRLAKAVGEMQNPPLDSVNPHFKNKFSSLRAVSDAVRPALAANGLAYRQTPLADESGTWVATIVYGEDGSIELARVPYAPQPNPQQNGSALTYAKRYCLQAAFGLVGEEDDDGEAASRQTPSKPRNASKGTSARKPAQRAADGPSEAEKAELAEIAAAYGDKRDVWNAYQANGMEGARALLAMVAPAQVELADADIEFGAAS